LVAFTPGYSRSKSQTRELCIYDGVCASAGKSFIALQYLEPALNPAPRALFSGPCNMQHAQLHTLLPETLFMVCNQVVIISLHHFEIFKHGFYKMCFDPVLVFSWSAPKETRQCVYQPVMVLRIPGRREVNLIHRRQQEAAGDRR
jgi:hypothetical protein